ncbi:disease resistance protein RPV1-like [Eucalyptus grandis]|uniref:disease resistance protein RPV1-like n=1 Tax=Eucalyptus grandis TaxID=71139 RepID=UPI00192E87A2|nr:disease resistance protein RPV1-like [Eucalyptus grandis]
MKRKEPTHLEDPIHEASASSASPQVGDYEGGTKRPKGNEYEVFLSFRGKDTRKGFTDYLYTSLIDAGIHVFRDDNELRVGEELGSKLLYSITKSKISIPIISEDYAASKWCLRELVQMLKCKRSIGQIVLPIFYKVGPSQVRHLIGRLRDSINAHRENLDDMVLKEWEEALKEVSSLKGWESEKIDNGHEGALVEIVVKKVMYELNGTSKLIVPKELVGIDDRVEEIMSLIDAQFNDTRIIGIYGMGGIGKTTLAKVLYNNLSIHFEHLSFMASIRETSRRKGIEWLQKKLIYDILRIKYDVSNVDEGIGIIKSRFKSKQVLILLDDMDDNTHLNALAGDNSWFRAGSIVIVTTRNKSILNKARVGYMYQLNELSLDQSLILFSRHAFQNDSPQSHYEFISHDIVSTTGGLPLALEVIGSFLREKTEKVWKDTLKKLKKVLDKKVRETLRISYEALDYEERQIFLDIACFFIGSYEQSPTYMWGACSFFPGNGIEVLSLMSLVKIDKDGKLMMHDQLRKFGREIVRLENPKEPQEHSRLWIYKEAVDVLDNTKGTRKIEALRLGKYGREKRYTAEQFKELTNLRFLQVDGANFTGNFQNLLPQLRWLQWQGCPRDFAAVNFHPKKLVVLDLSWSGISEDWGGWGPLKMATKLKVLNLSHCHYLRRTPDLSTFKSLEILVLEECWKLEEIHPSIGDIKTLASLNVRRCWRLEELPPELRRMKELRELLINDTAIREIPIGGLMKLETLDASFCRRRLVQLPKFMDFLVSLTQLDLSNSWIEELPESIGSLLSLTQLHLHMTRIKELPESIGFLKKLEILDASDAKLAHIPSSIGHLTSLTKLDLKWTAIAVLPESIGNLQNLRILDVSATCITELPCAIGMLAELQELSASHCKNLEGLPSNIGKLVSLNKLELDRSGISGLPESISMLLLSKTSAFNFVKSLENYQNCPLA